MKNICIIPARGGSKRIPGKNIKPFLGKAIINYSIETALNSNLFSEVMVSTDSEEIAEVSKSAGAQVPFLRSKENSGDFASTADVLLEVLAFYHKESYDNFCCLYPTAPFISIEKLVSSYDYFEEENASTLITTCRFSYPPQRGLIIVNNKLKMKEPENEFKRSQDLEPIFHDAGQFYWGRVALFTQTKSLFTANTISFEISELEVQDIDNETDWQLAELKYQLLHASK